MAKVHLSEWNLSHIETHKKECICMIKLHFIVMKYLVITKALVFDQHYNYLYGTSDNLIRAAIITCNRF
jgi:hypothetical protein